MSVTPNPANDAEHSIVPPPGLVGDVARFIFDAAQRPVPEIALAGAIGFIAGIAGRAFNVEGTGLNQYVLLLARTGTGKEAIASGIDRLVDALADKLSGGNYANELFAKGVANFIGPADMASGQGLLRSIARRNPPSFVAIIGEFGLRFQQMADARANAADASLLRALLDLYSKSGEKRKVRETVYSDKEKNTGELAAPAVSLIGESTPETFYQFLNERMIANGLLPRFTIIEYNGPRPPRNRGAAQTQPNPDMLDSLARLVVASLSANAANRTTQVAMTPDAAAMLDAFDEYADKIINLPGDEVTHQLWNRAHLKALKLAALIAVGCNPEMPTITPEIAQWAKAQVERDIRKLIARFDSGEVGDQSGNLLLQQDRIRAVMRECLTRPFDEVLVQYGGENAEERRDVLAIMHGAKLVTHRYIQSRVSKLPMFNKIASGSIKAKDAIRNVIDSMVDNAEIQIMHPHQTKSLCGFNYKCYYFAEYNPKNKLEDAKIAIFFKDNPNDIVRGSMN